MFLKDVPFRICSKSEPGAGPEVRFSICYFQNYECVPCEGFEDRDCCTKGGGAGTSRFSESTNH
jgi:hypothetical protein